MPDTGVTFMDYLIAIREGGAMVLLGLVLFWTIRDRKRDDKEDDK